MEVCVKSCMDGYHRYQEIWMPFIGEVLYFVKEDDNNYNRCAVAIYKLNKVRPCDTCYFFIIYLMRENNEMHSGRKSDVFARFFPRRDRDSMQVYFQRPI